MSSSTIAANAARFPLEIASSLIKTPVRVNDWGRSETEEVARILVRAGQRKALESLVLADGVTASVKGVVARVLDQHNRALH